jgi:hypothetical protein
MAKASGRTKTRGAKAPNPTEAARELARHGLASFATLVYRRFELAAHLRMVIRQLERIERGEIDRLMLLLPPRHDVFPALRADYRRERLLTVEQVRSLIKDTGRSAAHLSRCRVNS